MKLGSKLALLALFGLCVMSNIQHLNTSDRLFRIATITGYQGIAITLEKVGKELNSDYALEKLTPMLDDPNAAAQAYIAMDSVLVDRQYNEFVSAPEEDRDISALDTTERDSLLIGLIFAGPMNDSDINQILSLRNTHARFDDEFRNTYMESLASRNPDQIEQGKVAIQTALSPDQKIRLKECYTKVNALENSFWHRLFDRDSTGACANNQPTPKG